MLLQVLADSLRCALEAPENHLQGRAGQGRMWHMGGCQLEGSLFVHNTGIAGNSCCQGCC